MKKWEDENAGTFLVLRRKTGFFISERTMGKQTAEGGSFAGFLDISLAKKKLFCYDTHVVLINISV